MRTLFIVLIPKYANIFVQDSRLEFKNKSCYISLQKKFSEKHLRCQQDQEIIVLTVRLGKLLVRIALAQRVFGGFLWITWSASTNRLFSGFFSCCELSD